MKIGNQTIQNFNSHFFIPFRFGTFIKLEEDEEEEGNNQRQVHCFCAHFVLHAVD